MRVAAAVFGLIFAFAGAVIVCLGLMAQKDVRDEIANNSPDVGWECSTEVPQTQTCVWGVRHNSRGEYESVAGEDTLPYRERNAALVSNVVVSGAALFVGGLVLAGGALAGRKVSTGPAVQPVSGAPMQWHGAP